MRLRRAYAVLLRIYYLMRGSISRVVQPIIWPSLDIILWGFIARYLNNVSMSNVNFLTVFLGAGLFWELFNRSMTGVTTAFFEDVWSRNFLNVFGTPIRISEYLAGLVMASISTLVIAIAIMLAITTFVFGLSFAPIGVMFAPFVLVLFVFGVAFGIIGTGIVLRFGPTAEWFIWPMPMVLAPFAAVFYPVASLPGWMQAISHLLPASYVFEGLRAMVAGKPAPWNDLAIGAALAVLDVVLACWFFQRMYLRSVRTGLIARYSAESVT